MLTQLLQKLIKRGSKHRTEQEIRELIVDGSFELALAATESLHPATPERAHRQLCLQAEISFRQHLDDDAAAIYERVLKLAPGFAEAHYGLALLKHAKGDYESAFHHALFAKNSLPTDPRYLAQLGLCHISLGNFPQAEDLLRSALHQASTDKSAWNNLGIALLSKGMTTEARSCFLNALKLDPTFPMARKNLQQLSADTHQAAPSIEENVELAAPFDHFLASRHDSMDPLVVDPDVEPPAWHSGWTHAKELALQGQREEAFAAIETLILANPDVGELAVLADRLYNGLGEADSGLAVLQAHLIRHPNDALAHLGIGQALLRSAAPSSAETHLRRALLIDNNNEEIYKYLGKSLTKQNRYAEALPLHEECQQRWPSDENVAQLAISYYHACDYHKSLSLFNELESKKLIDRFGLQSFYAQSLLYAGQTSKALQLMDKQLERLGSPPHLLATRAFAHLLVGDFAQGWDGYRYRQLGLNAFRVPPIAQWRGEPLEGKTIVVLAEQGLGDQIMFSSCIPDLISRNPTRVIVEAIDRVAPTLARSFPACEVIASKQDNEMNWLRDMGEVDFFIPISDLPSHFRRDLGSFPKTAYLQPAPERVDYWRKRLESLGPGPYIGTSWRGGTEQTRTAIRTLSPALLASLAHAIPAQWISLQYGRVQEELKTASDAGLHLTHWPEAIADLDEFAALVSALDAVVTVCNTTVHYAGAVGQEVWVLAPMVPEWRYGLSNAHMPWYPRVQILRQPALNAWEEVIDEAKQRLVDKFRPDNNKQNDKKCQ